jgi:hypothetical protein
MVTRDVSAIIGACLLSVGAGLAWLPLGFIVAGGLLFGLSLWGHVRNNPGAVNGPS